MIDYRDYSYSMVRFIATLMIIFCHTFQVIGFTLKYSKILGGIGDFLSTGVQIFLIMSGLLYGSKENLFEKEKPLHFFFRNSKKILLDYYIYSLLIILPVYSTLDWNGLYSFCVRLFRIITFSNGLFWGVHHLWFIPYIILCYLITPILYDIRNIAKTKLQMWLILLSLIFVFEIIEVAYKSYFIATWINCYAFGFFLPRLIKNWDSTRKQSLTIRCTVLFIISCCIWAVMSYLVKLHYINGKYTLKFFDYAINYTRSFNALFIIIATVMLYRYLFKNATPPPRCKNS